MTRSRSIAVFSTCALSGAAAIWLNHAAPPSLIDAAKCPGLLELTASLAATSRPNLPLATVLGAWHLAAVALTAAFTALAVWRCTQSLPSVMAIGLVAGASPLMLPSLAPAGATALAVGAAWWFAALGTGRVGVTAAGALFAAITPAMALPMALLTGAVVRRRAGVRSAAIAVAACLAGAAIALVLLPALPGSAAMQESLGCMIPSPTNALTAAFQARAALSNIGPLALALSALGLFAALFNVVASDVTTVSNRRQRLYLAATGLVAIALAAQWPAPNSVRAFAPLIVGLWLLIGRGLGELVGQTGTRRAGGLAVMVVLVAINLEPRVNARPSAAQDRRPLGHELLSRRDLQSILYALPSDSALVAEDAVTDILLRSLSASLTRSHRHFIVAERTPDAIARVRSVGRVFAFPRAQSELQLRGVHFVDGLTPPVPGIAEIAEILPCSTLTTTWLSVPAVTGRTQLAFVTDSDDARGPIVLYTSGPGPIEASPVEWPKLALRGFYTRRYDLAEPVAQRSLAEEIAADNAPAGHVALTGPKLARTELWRVPGAPASLMIEFSSPASTALAAQLPRGAGPVRLCPAFPFATTAFVAPVGR